MGLDIYNQLNHDLVKVKKNQISKGDQQLNLELEDNEETLSTLKEKHQKLEQEKTIIKKELNDILSRIERLTVTLQKQSGDISLKHRELDNEAMEIKEIQSINGDERDSTDKWLFKKLNQ